MTFWGIEIRPGKPYTHSFDRCRGRLRISQATLGIGSSTKTILVQCNVGNKSPVLLCALLPSKTESLQLDLEFEEADDVVFSVIGPRTVYLTGYYVGNSNLNLNDDTDSFGEDIANTDTEDTNPRSDEDEYEDSFIDDDDPGVLPPSPISSDGVDEVVDIKKPRKDKTRKRLKKKYQSVESDDDTSSWKQNTMDCIRVVAESDAEDSFRISSPYTKKKIANKTVLEGEENANTERVETGNRVVEDDETRAERKDNGANATESKGKVDTPVTDDEAKRIVAKRSKKVSKEGNTLDTDAANHSYAEVKALDEAKGSNINQEFAHNEPAHEQNTNDRGAGLPYNSLFPSTESGLESGMKPKKKRKACAKEGRVLEDGSNHTNATKENKAQQADTEAGNMDQDLPERNENDQRPNIHLETGIPQDPVLPSKEDGFGNIRKTKKRRKEQVVEAKSHEGSNTSCIDVLKVDQAKQAEVNTDSANKDLPVGNEELKPATDKNHDVGPDEEKKINKKKKKKSKIQDNDENITADVPILSKEGKETSIKDVEDKNGVVTSSAKVRTLSNGLIIEELESGNQDGKVAAPGKKVKVLFEGKLKESGQIVDSNIGEAPYRFRLGDKDIIEGWNVGVDGMRVGDKRRLIIPPSMGFGSQGYGENVPPNSWLVYDVELLGVR